MMNLAGPKKTVPQGVIILVVVVFLVGVPTGLYLAINAFLDTPACTPTHIVYTKAPATEGHIDFPAGTRTLDMYFAASMGYKGHCSRYMRFEIKPSDLTAVLASTRIKQPLSSSQKMITSEDLPDGTGWEVDEVTFYQSGSSSALDYDQKVLIDTSAPDVYVVYAITIYED